MSKTYFIATIPTNYETIALADTRDEAIRLASKAAYDFLKLADAISPDTNTPRKVAEYLGVRVFEMPMNSTSDDSRAEGLMF